MDILLDMGSGGTRFVKQFRRFNQVWGLAYLCGEPDYSAGWDKIRLKPKSIRQIQGRYDAFGVPNASMRLVTVNANNPLDSLRGIDQELARTLVPEKGVFISAHPVGRHPVLTEEFFSPIHFNLGHASVAELGFRDVAGMWRVPVARFSVPGCPDIVYPASPTILNRITELSMPEEFRNRGSGYLYSRNDAAPSISVWVRNDKPYVA